MNFCILETGCNKVDPTDISSLYSIEQIKLHEVSLDENERQKNIDEIIKNLFKYDAELFQIEVNCIKDTYTYLVLYQCIAEEEVNKLASSFLKTKIVGPAIVIKHLNKVQTDISKVDVIEMIKYSYYKTAIVVNPDGSCEEILYERAPGEKFNNYSSCIVRKIGYYYIYLFYSPVDKKREKNNISEDVGQTVYGKVVIGVHEGSYKGQYISIHSKYIDTIKYIFRCTNDELEKYNDVNMADDFNSIIKYIAKNGNK